MSTTIRDSSLAPTAQSDTARNIHVWDRAEKRDATLQRGVAVGESPTPTDRCECGAMTALECGEMPSRHCGLWEEKNSG